MTRLFFHNPNGKQRVGRSTLYLALVGRAKCYHHHERSSPMRLAAIAAAGFVVFIASDCPAASKITSWETGKVLDVERKQDLVGTVEHGSTFGVTSHSSTNAVYTFYEEYAIESDQFMYLTRERLRSERSKPALLTVNGPVKFHVDGPKLVILDNESKEHETTILKQVSKAQNIDAQTRRPDATGGTSAVEGGDSLDNDAVVKMVVGGLREDTVIRVIEARSGKYVLIPDAVSALKAAGIPQSVIAAMSAKMSLQR
jgi:hypothetical protein